MKTALISLGRLPKSLALCRALARAGWRIVVAEPYDRHLCGLSRFVAKSHIVTAPNEDKVAYISDMLRVVEREEVSLVVPVSEEIMHLADIIPQLPNGVRFFGGDFETLIPLHDKARFSALAQSCGLTVPQSALLGTVEGQRLAQAGPVVVKPSRGCAGQGVQFCGQGEGLPQAPPSGPPLLVQAALSGQHTSTFSIAHEGRVIGTVVYTPEILSNTVAAAFRQLPSGGTYDQEREWVSQFVAKNNFNGFISFDFIRDEKDVPHAIECNPRTTSGIHFVEEESLAEAVLNPQSCASLTMKPHPVMYQFWPVLTEVQHAMFRPGRGYFHKMGTLLKAKEANFEWGDGKPVWLQPWAAWPILKRASAMDESFGEAATRDIALLS